MDKINLHTNVIVTYVHPYNSAIVMRGCYQHYETMPHHLATDAKMLAIRKEEVALNIERIFRDCYSTFVYYDRAIMKISEVKVFPVKDSLPVEAPQSEKEFSRINKAIKKNLKESLESEVLGVNLNTIFLKRNERFEEFIRLNFDT